MRIIAGRWRSRLVKGPTRTMRLRPTPDALRERGFAVIGEEIRNSRFLDIFAGTGTVGIEALSRGAASLVSVESHRGAARIIEANFAAFGLQPPTARLIKRVAERAVRDLATRREIFDILWADPPFETWEQGLTVLSEAFECGIITDRGLACLECPDRAAQDLIPPHLMLERDLAGGASRLWMLRKRQTDQPDDCAGLLTNL